MLTPKQAASILSHGKPLALNDNFPIGVTPNHICLTPDVLKQLGISESVLSYHGGELYDGTDYQNGHQRVHVFEKDGLQKLAALSWVEYEKVRRDAQGIMEVGG